MAGQMHWGFLQCSDSEEYEVKVWRLDRLTVILCLIELVLWMVLVYLSGHREILPTVKFIVQVIHVISLSFVGFAWLVAFGHGRPPVGDLSIWHQAFLVVVLVLQLILVVAVLKLYRRWRAGRR